jgi:putative tryptophan/tyrosine transport system substrate-binding protein
MRRREFITLFGGAMVALPLTAHAQQGEHMRRIGVLHTPAADDSEGQARSAAYLQGLQQLGWTDGRNVRIDTRWAADDARILLREKRLSELQRVALRRDLDRIEAVLDGITTPASASASNG